MTDPFANQDRSRARNSHWKSPGKHALCPRTAVVDDQPTSSFDETKQTTVTRFFSPSSSTASVVSSQHKTSELDVKTCNAWHDDDEAVDNRREALQLQKSGLSAKQLRAFNLIVFKRVNVHIAGAAGTGKSHLLAYTVRALKRLKLHVALTATTGVAADNLNQGTSSTEEKATTINWWIGCGWFTGSAEDEAYAVKHNPVTWQRWKTTDVLIIDEISMMHPLMFCKIDRVARILRAQPDKPFGGLQVVLCGDWFQLEPVDKTCNDYCAGRGSTSTTDPRSTTYVQFCMETQTWKDAIDNENVVILTENFRQQKDPVFQKLLDEIREGILTDDSEALLNSRINAPLTDLPRHILPTYLLPLDKQVKEENQRCLLAHPGETRRYVCKTELINVSNQDVAEGMIQKLKRDHRIQDVIELKIGVPVMLLVNLSVKKGFVNGLQGTVISFDPQDGNPLVKFTNGNELKVTPKAYATYKPNGETWTSMKKGVRLEQLPITVSYALSIHKTQSLTLSAVKINLGSDVWAGGQAYVALSRVQTLKGLCLTAFDRNCVKINPRVIKFYDKFRAFDARVITARGCGTTDDDDKLIHGNDHSISSSSLPPGFKNELVDLLDSFHPLNTLISQGRMTSLKRPRPPRKDSNPRNPSGSILSIGEDTAEEQSKKSKTTTTTCVPGQTTSAFVSHQKDIAITVCPL